MTDTNMTDEWVQMVCAKNPMRALENGNFLTGPVRLSFPNIFKRSKPIPPNTEGKFGANLVFPLGVDLSVLKQAAGVVAKEKWPQAGTPQGPKLKSPFKPQDEMLKYAGYNEGGEFLTAIADRQPPCVAMNMAPITEIEADKRVYPGVWAICSIRPFAYDKGVNKGVSFGLQSVMIIADDVSLGGGGSDPNKDFAGVQIDQAVNPAAMFGAEGPTAGQQAPVDLFS